MLFITSILSLSLIIVSSLVNNLVINFIGDIGRAPMYGLGGCVTTYNQSNHDEINMVCFNNFLDYPIEWCEMQHKYINVPDVIIKVEPTYSVEPCAYDTTKFVYVKNIAKYQILDQIAIVLSAIELLGSLIIDTCIYFSNINFYNVMIKNTYLSFAALQIVSFILILCNIIYLMPYDLGYIFWTSKNNPIKENIGQIYICLICTMIIFNIFINLIHKYCYVLNKTKKQTEENQMLLESE